MSSASSLPVQANNLIRSVERQPGSVDEEALVAVSQAATGTPASASRLTACLPIELDIAVLVRSFKARNLIALAKGQVIESQWGHGEGLPLATGDVELAWCEFEVVESRLAVRVSG